MGQELLRSAGSSAVLERLKATLGPVPVVLVGDTADAAVCQALDGGAQAVIPLPLKLESVRAAVDQALGRPA